MSKQRGGRAKTTAQRSSPTAKPPPVRPMEPARPMEDAQALLTAAVQAHGAGRLSEAAGLFRRLLKQLPDNVPLRHNLAAIVRDLGDHRAAADGFRRSLAIMPAHLDSLINLALTAKDMGDAAYAGRGLRRAARLKPDHGPLHSFWGVLRVESGDVAGAVAAQRRAVALTPDRPEGYNNLGNLLRERSFAAAALTLYDRAARLAPDQVVCVFNRVLGLHDAGRLDECVAAAAAGVRRWPFFTAFLDTACSALKTLWRFTEAAATARRLTALSPASADAYVTLGAIAKERCRFDEAEKALRRAVFIKPDDEGALNLLGVTARERGRLGEGLVLLDLARRAPGAGFVAHSNFAFALHSVTDFTPGRVLELHREIGALMARRFPPLTEHANAPDPDRRIKIGYVSPDLYSHSVTYFLESALDAHDRARFHIACYADNRRTDPVTRRLKGKVDAWRTIVGLSDDQVFQMIVDDGIDILVDLAGHTGGNRLTLFARKPAPVQATWLGYPGSTGLPTMDYRITDLIADPPEADAWNSETLLRLGGGFLCYRPYEDAPPPRRRPLASSEGRDGPVFGSFNMLTKMAPETLAMWVGLLQAIPNARLVLKSKTFIDPTAAAAYLTVFSDKGIAAERIELIGRVASLNDHLEGYGRIDVALDTFPYNGTTTTFEALWMGAPVVTLAGDRHVARVGADILTRLGLEALVAQTPEDYIAIARALVADPARLDALSRSLRDRMRASTLCDAAGFTRQLEAAFRSIWGRWCEQRRGAANPPAAAIPEAAPALFDAGVAAMGRGDVGAGEAAFRAFLRAAPEAPEGWINFGTARKALGRLGEASDAFKRAIALRPDYAAAYGNLCAPLCALGMAAAGEAAGRWAIRLDPHHRTGIGNLGLARAGRGDMEGAIRCHRAALMVDPASVDVHNNLATALFDRGRLTAAADVCRRALLLDRSFAESWANLAIILTAQGAHAQAAAAGRRALCLKPTLTHVACNHLLSLHYDPSVSPAAAYREHLAWAPAVARGAAPRVHRRPPASELGRRLRVGYVSADFCGHSVAFFFMPPLMAHGPAVETFCYADVLNPDYFTDRLRGVANHWRSIVGMDDAAVARLIEADGIDILVDLAGHTARNRLGVFAFKPAPVQATWLGYPNTTGLAAIDYRLTDAVADPPGEADDLCRERLVRLPQGFLCYGPGPSAPETAPLPALANGYVTFGSFNNLSKLTPATATLWSGALLATPGSRLLLKARALADPATRERVTDLFAERGVAPERLELLPFAPYLRSHLEIYGRVDIALDPHPYNGTTTTCEALWMGAPTLTMRGDRHAARVGASLLTRVGLPQLVAEDPDDFAARAARLAADVDGLAGLRAGLRARVASSPLCDAPGFARALEDAYRAMWRAWITGETMGEAVSAPVNPPAAAPPAASPAAPAVRIAVGDGPAWLAPDDVDDPGIVRVLTRPGQWRRQLDGLARALAPGDGVLDWRSGIGGWALAAARAVGSSGVVWAMEPDPAARQRLATAAQAQGLTWLQTAAPPVGGAPTALPPALAWVRIGAAEQLDGLIAALSERRVADARPAVEIDVMTGGGADCVRAALTGLGWRPYREAPALGMLAAIADDEDMAPRAAPRTGDRTVMVPPERAPILAARGVLAVEGAPPGDGEILGAWRAAAAARPALAGMLSCREWADVGTGRLPQEAAHLAALDAHAWAWAPDRAAARRLAGLRLAFDCAQTAAAAQPGLSRLFTLARLAGEIGARTVARSALDLIGTILAGGGRFGFDEPFLPLTPAFDAAFPPQALGDWVVVSLMRARDALTVADDDAEAAIRALSGIANRPFADPGDARRLALARRRRDAMAGGRTAPRGRWDDGVSVEIG